MAGRSSASPTTSGLSAAAARIRSAPTTPICRYGSPPDPLDMQADAISRFLLAQQGEGRKKSSVQRLGAMLRSFARFLQYDGVSDNLPRLAPLPARTKVLPQVMTEGEVQRIINACEDGTPVGKRDRAFIELAYGAGMRASELCHVRLRDLDAANGILYARGKGDKERILYLNQACRDALAEYLKVRPVDGVKDKNALFLSNRMQRISPKTVQHVVYTFLEKAGLAGQGLSVHKLRHTAATLMYQHGKVDVLVLKEILGHENLGTTEIYTHIMDDQMKSAAEANPLHRQKAKKQAQK